LSPSDATTAPVRGSETWTPERLQRLRVGCAAGETKAAILAALNALPGQPIPTVGAVHSKASRMGLAQPTPKGAHLDAPAAEPRPPRPLPPLPAPAAPRATSAPAADFRCITGERAEAEALFAKGMTGRQVAEELDLPLGDVARWIAAWREGQEQSA